MQTLSNEFLDQCPVEGGFRLRGHKMTRLDVFIDAAFAFAVTLLVISYDRIPQSFDEIVVAIKAIPAFTVAVIQLVWIWRTHSQWSERYGLRNATTVTLSTALLIIMLIYIYPMRIMFTGMFDWMTGGYLPSLFAIDSVEDARLMFVFLGCGFAALCTVFFLMYRYAAASKEFLRLSEYEYYESRTSELIWLGSIGISLISITFALLFPPNLLQFSGFGYALLGIWVPAAIMYRLRSQPKENSTQD